MSALAEPWRLSTVRACDLMVEMADCRIEAPGIYEYLLRDSASFRPLATQVHTAVSAGLSETPGPRSASRSPGHGIQGMTAPRR